MSRIHDALKKLEAERAAGKSNGHAGTNGHAANGGGNGRRGWQWLLAGMGRAKSAMGAPVNFDVGPEVEEAYQRLGTSVLAPAGQAQADQAKLLGVVASRHGEGTTTTAAVFASILVRRRGGRVAVVECNLRTPSFDTAFGIRPAPGFAEVIEGRAPLADAAQPTKVHDLFAITGGETALGPATLFDSPGLPAALEALRQQFEFVILDLPPINVYGDALILGQRLDAAVIVIEADATRVSEVERARRTLERGGVRCMGSVLNRRRNYIPGFVEEML